MDSKGFTLIELMIVIAIIGILAAIAIPNFIAYRNKSFCSAAEGDANGIAASIADYFAIPNHVDTPVIGQLNDWRGYNFSREGTATENTGTVVDGGDPNINITITVTDGSGRCPEPYQRSQAYDDTNRRDGWDGDNVFYKYISLD
jgi:prepilin-type N-terminal cleavage/methylation domain-containing protein